MTSRVKDDCLAAGPLAGNTHALTAAKVHLEGCERDTDEWVEAGCARQDKKVQLGDMEGNKQRRSCGD